MCKCDTESLTAYVATQSEDALLTAWKHMGKAMIGAPEKTAYKMRKAIEFSLVRHVNYLQGLLGSAFAYSQDGLDDDHERPRITRQLYRDAQTLAAQINAFLRDYKDFIEE